MECKPGQLHSAYLDLLVHQLEVIDEDSLRANWIMKEGIWLKRDSRDMHKFCDLVIEYDDHFSLIELKNSNTQRRHAVKQLESTMRFLEDFVRKDDFVCKVAYYKKGLGEYEII